MVRYGITSWTWVYPFDASIIPRVKEIGFDGLEIPIEDPSIMNAREVREKLESYQLECSSICAVMSEDRDPTSLDKAVRDNAIKYLKFCIDFASEVGCDIVAGPIYAAVGKVLFDDKKAAWNTSVSLVREVARYALDRGIYLGVEPLNRYETSMINLVSDALRYVEDIGVENVKIHFDTYHANIEEKSLGDAIRSAGKMLYHVHSCENDRGTPGSGHIPWSEVAQALKDIGYDRWLVIETFQPGIKEIAVAASIWRPLEKYQELIAINGLKFLKSLFE
ncbi:MAG: sugar phosphate isomerase/epimerase [Thaumarchaeota archaeon]|nr:MAG: sugar phosphate isomerase/epimerase [Nitrososphaerota archaeon]